MKLRAELIEIALPLEGITAPSAREKKRIRQDHCSILHLCWATCSLAAVQAGIGAQIVDAPSEHIASLSALQQTRRKAGCGRSETPDVSGPGFQAILVHRAPNIQRRSALAVVKDLLKRKNTPEAGISARAAPIQREPFSDAEDASPWLGAHFAPAEAPR